MDFIKARTLLIITGLVAIMAFGFMNCSNVEFEGVDGNSAKIVDPGALDGEPITEDNSDELQDELEDMGDEQYPPGSEGGDDGDSHSDDDGDGDSDSSDDDGGDTSNDDDGSDDRYGADFDGNCGGGEKSHKVLVCHVPSGNPANAHTICIAIKALKAHEHRHGADGTYDTVGSCDDRGQDDDT